MKISVRRVTACALTTLVCTSTLALSPAPAGAATIGITRVNAPGISGGVMYIDGGGYCAPNGSTRPDGAGGVGPGYDYDANGTVSVPGVGPVSSLSHGRCPGPYNASAMRVELYPIPYGGTWDPFTSPAGGMHFQGNNGGSFGVVTLPSSTTGGIKVEGKLFAATGGFANGRISIDLFQDDGFRTPGRGAFGSFDASKGDNVSLGWIFPGGYNMFVTDHVTGVKIRIITSFAVGDTFNLDLDATCMGFDLCSDEGNTYANAPTPGGSFHPLNPTRILDTRSGLGISNGGIRVGDGRLPNEPDNTTRDEWLWNHQLKVTGVAGVPEHGVSAVLLNMTVTGPWSDGWLAVYPKLARRSIYDDQSLFRNFEATSNLNFKAGETLPNLVVARVGAGGHIMLENASIATHAIADIAGWFDTGSGSGDGFRSVTPLRIMDTRNADKPALAGGETRTLKVTGIAGVPANATAVALNVTQIEATADGFVTIWPDGTAQPIVSNLNGAPGRTRPNMVVVKVGAGGKVKLFNYEGSSHLAVDVVGYMAPGGGKTYTINPKRTMDTRSGVGSPARPLGSGEVRDLAVRGVGGVPANATAVIANVTGVQSTTGTFLTVFPSGVAKPVTSNVNLDINDPAPNLVMMGIGSNGAISIANDRGQVHVIVDVVAYVI
jgi:hypothetical protein